MIKNVLIAAATAAREAIKNALELKAADPSRDITILYRDIRTFAFKEDYYKKAREANIKFISYEEDRKPEVIASGDKVDSKVSGSDS